MKKSRGTAFRTTVQKAGPQAREAPVRSWKKSGRWKGYLAAGGAVICLIALILPCQYRRCGNAGDAGMYAYRWVLPDLLSGTLYTKPADMQKGPDYPAGNKRHAATGEASNRNRGPVDGKRTGDQGDVKAKDRVRPSDEPEQLGRIETAERGTVRPDVTPDRKGGRGADDGDTGKKIEKPKVYDFGTKIELVPAPEAR